MRLRLGILLAVTVLSPGAMTAQKVADESSVIRKIELLRGRVTRDDQRPGRPLVGVSFFGSLRVKVQHLHLLRACKDLKSLDLSRVAITDVGLDGLANLSAVTTLDLSGCEITNACLPKLGRLKKLNVLRLSYNKFIGGAGLKELSEARI